MSIDAVVRDALTSLSADAPVAKALIEMQLGNQARSGLDDRTYLLVRLAALVALDASAPSYLINFTAADEFGVSVDEVRSVLIAIAPVVGSARTVAAADHALRAVTGRD
jgi:4-carboxymuconolactone decarboxylase